MYCEYTIGQLLEAVDKQIKIEKNKVLKCALLQLRTGYINEINQYFYNLFESIYVFVNKEYDQTQDDLEKVYDCQFRLFTLYDDDDLKYCIRHFYKTSFFIDWVKSNHDFKIDIDKKYFIMSNLVDDEKLFRILQKYAKSDIAKVMLLI